MIYIAIDPGKSGAVAVAVNGNIEAVDKCPDTVADMANLMRNHKTNFPDAKVVIEKVHAMPGQGVTSMFTFGQNLGQWEGILASLNMPCLAISPQKWQKMIGTMAKEKADRKRQIKDWAQKMTGLPITLYAADAVAMALLAPKM